MLSYGADKPQLGRPAPQDHLGPGATCFERNALHHAFALPGDLAARSFPGMRGLQSVRNIILGITGFLLTAAGAGGQEVQFEELSILKSRFEMLGGMVNRGDGYFYGVARWAESNKAGLIFRVAPGREAEVLHEFNSIASGNDPNTGGANPSTAIRLGPDGAFYGATDMGGAYGNGVAYRLSPEGAFSVVHEFRYEDGISPNCVLPMPDGSLYGTTGWGGPNDGGTLFHIGADGSFRIAYAFDRGPSIPPWQSTWGTIRSPHAPIGLAVGPDGALYGMTHIGGVVSFSFSYGYLYRYDAPGSIALLKDFGSLRETGGTPVPFEDGFLISTKTKMLRVATDGSSEVLADFDTGSIANVINLAGNPVIMPDGIYGMTDAGGYHGAGTVYRLVPGSAPVVLHDFSSDYFRRRRCLVAGNDAQVYGLAAFPEDYQPAAAQASVAMARVPVESRAKPSSKAAGTGPRTFRFRRGGQTANQVPVAGHDLAWLPAKPTAGRREVTVPVLANDFDPDGDALSISVLAGDGEGTAEVVATRSGPGLRFITTAADPAGRRIAYRLDDGQGGTSTGWVTILSNATGTYHGSTAATGGAGPAAGDLVVKVAAKNKLTATFTAGGIRYTGKGVLDGDETSDVSLRAKGRAPLALRIGLRRAGPRAVEAWISGPDFAHAGSCPLVPTGGR